MNHQGILSIRLYDVLEKVGASEKMRKLHRRLATTQEILKTVSRTTERESEWHIYLCGSYFEGSVTPELSSDVDIIDCFTALPVVLDPHATPPGYSLLAVSDEWTYPGYVKLQPILYGCPLTDVDMQGALLVSDAKGRACQGHFTKENTPAERGIDENGKHFLDKVAAFKCNVLPIWARDRFETLRKRRLICGGEFEKLIRMGCMFVSVGHFQSMEKDIEWRMSFSLQERHLMSKLNPTQHKVFIILKLIKKNIVEKVLGCNVLATYHLKTCVLYAVMMSAAQSWTPVNLLKCLMQCVKLLILWLKNAYCPNFVTTEQNLFSKRGFSHFRKDILCIMDLLLKTNNTFFTLLHSDHIADILLEGERRWRDEINMEKNKITFECKYHVVICLFSAYPTILRYLCRGHYDPSSLVTALSSLQQTNTITEHTANQTQAALAYLYPWFHLHIAKTIAYLSFTSCDVYLQRKLLRMADYHFKKAEMTDRVNVRLAKASVLYKAGRFEACFWLLNAVENAFTSKVYRLCPCTHLHKLVHYNIQDVRDIERTLSNMSVLKFTERHTFCCVILLPSTFDSVPCPLRYEMLRSYGTRPGSRDEHEDFWFDWCVVDAKVYLYFMQYLVCEKLQKESHKQAAIGNIRAVIEEDNMRILVDSELCQLGHRETAYNLLGWIYMQEQRYGDALQCFLNSWEIRPSHNAAKFHMRDLMTKVAEVQMYETIRSSSQ